MNFKALLILIAGHLVTDINTGALPAFLPFLKESLALSYTMTAAIILVFNVTSSVIQPFFGYCADRWPARWLLPVGCFFASLGLALVGFGTSYGWILFFVALTGLGQASYHPEGFKTVNLLAGPKKATAMAVFIVGGNLGFSLGPLLATFFYAQQGLKGSFWFLLPGVAMTAFFLLNQRWKIPEETRPAARKKASPSPFPRESIFPLFILIATVVLRSISRLGLVTFVPFYFIKILDKDPLLAGQYLTAFLLAGTSGVLVGGPFADRFGYKKTVLYSLAVSTLLLYLFLYTVGTWSFIFFTVAGLTLISSNSVTMVMGQSYMPGNLGMASGLIMGLSMGIGGIAATVLGWVADVWGLGVALQILCIMPLLGFLVFSFIPYPPADSAAVSPALSTPKA